MNIGYDATPLLSEEKTGIGFVQSAAVTTLSAAHKADRFSLCYFCLRGAKKKRGYLAAYLRENVTLSPCTFFDGGLYRLLYGFLPLPYSLFFRRRMDITHFFNFLVPPGVRGKTVATVHDTAFLVYPDTVRTRTRLLLKWNMRRSLRRADRVVTVSEFTRDELTRFYGVAPEKVRVIHNCVDSARFRADLSEKEIARRKSAYRLPEEYLLYVGTLEPRKNLVRLVEAYAAFRQKHREAPALVLAGRNGWMYESIYQKVEELGLQDSVHFPGYVDEKDKPYLIAGAKIFVFPSLYEGFGIPVLEAMACGVPVLTSNTSSLPEVCENAALLVAPQDSDAIAKGLARLYTDEALREQLIERGLARAALPEFTKEFSAEALYQVYLELMHE